MQLYKLKHLEIYVYHHLKIIVSNKKLFKIPLHFVKLYFPFTTKLDCHYHFTGLQRSGEGCVFILDHNPWCIGPHYTAPRQPPPPLGHDTWVPPGFNPGPLLVTSCSHHWISVPICSLDLTVQPPSPGGNIWQCPLKQVRYASGWYASYWKAFLLYVFFDCSDFLFVIQVWPEV